MKNMHIKYFMVLTVFILGLGDVPLHAAKKSGSSSTPPKPAQSTQAPAAPQLSSQYKKELTDILKAVHDSENILKKLQKDLTDQKDSKAKQQTSKDLSASLASVKQLEPQLRKLLSELPIFQTAHLMMNINSKDITKALALIPDIEKNIKIVQKLLNSEVTIQGEEKGKHLDLVAAILFLLAILAAIDECGR